MRYSCKKVAPTLQKGIPMLRLTDQKLCKEDATEIVSDGNLLTTVVKSTAKNVALLRSRQVVCLVLAMSLVICLYQNLLMIIPFDLGDRGFDGQVAAWALATAGGFNFAARLLVTFGSDCVPVSTRVYLCSGSALLAAAMIGTLAYTDEPLMKCRGKEFKHSYLI